MKRWFPTKERKKIGNLREVRCQHCKASLNITNLEDLIVFCDEGCLMSYICEQNQPTKAETLDAIEFQRQYEEVI